MKGLAWTAAGTTKERRDPGFRCGISPPIYLDPKSEAVSSGGRVYIFRTGHPGK